MITSGLENEWEASSQRRLRPCWALHHIPGDQPWTGSSLFPQDCPSCQCHPHGSATPTGQLTTLPPTSFQHPTSYKHTSSTQGVWSQVPCDRNPVPWFLGSQGSSKLSCPQSFSNENYFSIPGSPWGLIPCRRKEEGQSEGPWGLFFLKVRPLRVPARLWAPPVRKHTHSSSDAKSNRRCSMGVGPLLLAPRAAAMM